MTNEFEKWFDENSIWMPDNSAMMYEVWSSILEFTSKHRTCENCKYGTGIYNDGKLTNFRCKLRTENQWSYIYELDFGCNKFNRRMK